MRLKVENELPDDHLIDGAQRCRPPVLFEPAAQKAQHLVVPVDGPYRLALGSIVHLEVHHSDRQIGVVLIHLSARPVSPVFHRR